MSNETGKENYVELTADQWREVISKASAAPKSDMHLFILRSVANQQSVSYGSIAAFRGELAPESIDRRLGSLAIGSISQWVKDLLADTNACWFIWNNSTGEWCIGYDQREALRKAFES